MTIQPFDAMPLPAPPVAEEPQARPQQPLDQDPRQAQPTRGPMRSLENLLSHAPRDLMKPGGRGMDQLLKQIGVKLDRLTAGSDQAYRAARVQLDFSFQAVREINRATGDETVAMRMEFSASIQTLSGDQEQAQALSVEMSGEMFFGAGRDPAALFEQTFGADRTAEAVAAHAFDRYAGRVARDPDVQDTPENRSQYADLVREAVEQAAQRIKDRQGEDSDAAQRISRTQQRLEEMLDRFVEQGLESMSPPDEQTRATVIYQRSLCLEITRQRMLLSSYSPQGQSDIQEPPADAQEVDAAA
jgi:hypothetical protein